MSKANTIRKKALDLVRQQDWPNAIKEYRRLVELDQNNPNVHNELADLYLRTNQKNEAFESFILAIDEYTRLSLFNNAVAVCKKVLRVLPARVEVLNKLGLIRMKQGLAKEAESYYLSFLEKAAGGSFESSVFLKLAGAIAAEMPSSPHVLQKLGQCMLGYRLNDEAADVLIQLYVLQEKSGDASGCEDTRAIVAKLGAAAKLDAVAGKSGRPVGRTVVTEDNLWTKKHSEGERIDIESTPRFAPPNPSQNPPPTQPTTAPAPQQPAGAVSGGPSERDQWLLRLARGVGGAAPKSKAPTPEAAAPAAAAAVAEELKAAPPPEVVSVAATDEADDVAEEQFDDVPEAVATAVEPAVAEEEIEEPDDDLEMESEMPSIPEAPAEKAKESFEPARAARPVPAAPPVVAPAAAKESIQISAMIQDDEDLGGEEDYRSHYDLGMAYIEMDLLSEAIREYQIASKSPQFQVKCLEMIGVCFLKQNQPQLAIRQLSKGLSLIGNENEESMGIKYNLGLAYEMIGDDANARAHFEDVYVVDVTFREVAQKIKKLSGS